MIIDAEGRRPKDGRISSGVGRVALIAFAAAIRMSEVMAALFALGRQRLPVQMSGPGKPLVGGDGRHARNAQECRDTDGDGADDREGDLPGF